MTEPGRDCVKMVFPLEDDADGFAAETMWVRPLENGNYRLENSPFSAFAINFGDVVAGELVDGRITFKRVVKRSGNQTIRLKLKRGDPHTSFLALWDVFEREGCFYERGGDAERGHLYAITVPPNANFKALHASLWRLENERAAFFEEASIDPSVWPPKA